MIASIVDLPDGTFIVWAGKACLVWDAALHEWQPDGYQAPIARPTGVEVTVLTPRSVVGALAEGYRVAPF